MDVFICCTLYIHVLRTYAHFRAFYPPAYLLPTHAWVLLPCAIPHSAQLGLCVCTRAPPYLQDVACIALTHPSARCLELPAFVVMPQPAYQSCFTLVLAHKHAHIAANDLVQGHKPSLGVRHHGLQQWQLDNAQVRLVELKLNPNQWRHVDKFWTHDQTQYIRIEPNQTKNSS